MFDYNEVCDWKYVKDPSDDLLARIHACVYFYNKITFETTLTYPATGGADLKWHDKCITKETKTYLTKLEADDLRPAIHNGQNMGYSNFIEISSTSEVLEGDPKTMPYNYGYTSKRESNIILNITLTEDELIAERKALFATYVAYIEKWKVEQAKCQAELERERQAYKEEEKKKREALSWRERLWSRLGEE